MTLSKKYIAFWGYPNPQIIEDLKSKYPNFEWLDLDIDFNSPDMNILPAAYCKIIKNIFNNAIFYKDEIFKIVAPIGKDKCDSGWFAAKLLREFGFDVVESIFEDIKNRKPLIYSVSNLPLKEKVMNITGSIVTPTNVECHEIPPKFGFWGVPPNDLNLLDLFPNETHIYGWTRCVEAGVPADLDLEMYVNPDIPTVFYAQAFCAKTQLAKYLANKYNGLYIDVDDYPSNSVKAKIEAFLRLR